jgi:hypothetical protein
MANSQNRCLILFAREPVAGRVKTRLESALGIEGTLRLYQRMLAHQIALVSNYPNATAQLWVDGDSSHSDFDGFNGSLHQQQGEDIGERMRFALQQALRIFSSAVLIGCDCPDFSSHYFDKAFSALDDDSDVVLGPANDGGYVLIGMREAREDIFQQVEWGSAQVMEQTRLRMRSNNLRWQELESLHDIDVPDDLAYLENSGLLQTES